jgi:uncharacterized protein YidB (DUF937 family)
MASGSLKALLTVLAVAGYQNRDKIAEILKNVTDRPEAAPHGAGGNASSSPRQEPGGGGMEDILAKLRNGGLGTIISGGTIGSILNGGLTDLLDQFRQSGQQQKADSWVKPGANEPIDNSDLASALGPDVLKDIAARTGLSEEEVLTRLAKNLPDAVDGLTPHGRMQLASSV